MTRLVTLLLAEPFKIGVNTTFKLMLTFKSDGKNELYKHKA